MFSGSSTSLSFLSPSSILARSLLPGVNAFHFPRRSFFVSPSSHSFRLQNDAFRPENWTRNYSTAALPFDLSPPPIDHDLIIMEGLNLGDLVGQPYGSHKHYSVNGNPVTIAVGNIISEEGFSLLVSPATAKLVWKAIVDYGAVPMGSNAWEELRIIQGC
nr:putative transferase At1g60990, chloroplastic isoform X2 [Ipomoea batatas]